MRPAFSSVKSAAAFTLLLLVLLSLPVVGSRLLPPREQSYATLGWGSGPYPYLQQQIFEEKGDINVAFMGSSHILHCLDARRVQDELSKKLGRPSTVRVLGWGGAGFDALYFVAKDLLEHRKVGTLVLYDDHNGTYRNDKSPIWFRFDDDAKLRGLPFRDHAHFYFAALVGMPKNLLGTLRSPLAADLDIANYWQTHYGSPKLQTTLGSTTSALQFTEIDADPSLPFQAFTPHTGATSADARIYSPATKDDFQFGSAPILPWEAHFIHLLAEMAKQHGTQLVLMHIPVLEDIRQSRIEERAFWPDYFGSDLAMIGIPPAKMFAGLSDAEVHRLFFNPSHLNKNGQAYFTSLILPDLLQLCEPPPTH